jgi:hypothetical protein
MTALKTKILFCDALPVYEKLPYHKRTLPDVMVVTRSFVMAQKIKNYCVYIDENVSAGQRKHFKSGIPNVERRLIKQFNTSGVSEPEKNIFLQLFNGFQNDILDAILLETVLNLDSEVSVAVPKTNMAHIDEVLRPCWIDWLDGIDKFELINVDVSYHNERSPRGNVETGIIERLKLGGFEAVLWKIAQQSWVPETFFKANRIGVVGQTELAREGVVNCLLHAYKPAFIFKPKISPVQVECETRRAKAILDICEPIILDRLSLISSKFLRTRAKKLLSERLSAQLDQFDSFLAAWRKKIDTFPDLQCIISGYCKGPEAMALAEACHERGIKIASFQHGITREILQNVEERRVFFETSFCDVFFTMNPVAAKITKFHSVKQPVTVVAKNWPSPFKRIATKPKKAIKPMLFVSTNLYSGHKPNGVPPMNDSELCDLEMGLVTRVFGQLDVDIDYKPYPAIRYLDRDPVLKAVNEQKNMSVVGTHQELRYLLGQYRLFITTKATSTVSWVVATGKPLLFIDHYCHARLSEDARDAFLQSFFLFDQRDVDFESRLKTFLRRPFDEILEEWDSKSLQRSKTIEQFFGGEQERDGNQIFHDIWHHCLSI